MSVEYQVIGGTVHLAGNPIEIVLTASAPLLKHKLALKIMCDSLISPVQIEEYEPQDLVATANIKGLVNEPIPSEFHFPITGISTGHDALARVITFDVGEIWIDENGDRQEAWAELEADNTLRIIDGKLRDYELALLNEDGKSFSSEYINGGKFLTNLPNYQKVSPTQIVKLWYLGRWSSDHPANLRTKVNLNNKTAHIPMSHEVVLYTITGIVELSINPIFQGFELDPLEKIVSFEVWLEDESGDVSERRTYLVDNAYHPREFYFFYRNPFSVIDSIWLTGSCSKKLKTEIATTRRYIPSGSGTKVPGVTTTSASGQRRWDLNTGPKKAAELLAYRDFLEAKERWMIDPDRPTKLIPVFIESDEYEFDNSMKNIQDFDIKILEAY